jgi:hypothetical protein
VNRNPARLTYLDADTAARIAGVLFDGDNVIGAGASLGAGASWLESWSGTESGCPTTVVRATGYSQAGAFTLSIPAPMGARVRRTRAVTRIGRRGSSL